MQPITATLVDTVRKHKLGGQLLDDGTLRYVVFLEPVRMRVIRRFQREPMTKTIERRAGAFDVIVNGNYYDVGYIAGAKARMGTADDPSETKIQGQVVFNGKVEAGDSRPERFYIAEIMNTMRRSKKDPAWRYEVGRGDPPARSVW